MQENIRKILKDKTQAAVFKVDNEQFGDYATNIALILAKKLSQDPMKVAQQIITDLNPAIANFALVTAVKPGFINFSLLDAEIVKVIEDINSSKGTYGENSFGKGKRVNVEFVSANPTGPLHIGNARGGPIGDVLASVLAKSGYQVTREYYHNNLGVQVARLGESILYYIKKAKGEEAVLPEGGYKGSYIKDLADQMGSDPNAKRLSDLGGQTPMNLGKVAVEYYLKDILEVCQKIGIKFDKISKESQIKTDLTVEVLTEKNLLKQKDGALWFAPHDDLLADRECVVVKSDGAKTYFANDIAYHLQKLDEGNDLLIDVWGANHFGHIPRMQAAMNALGHKDKLQVVLYQWVTLIRHGQEVSMHKRTGNFVTAQEVLNEVGADALRWFFLDKDAQSHIKFDLDLAKKQSKENPVYYVQYAHARMCSVLGKAEGEGEHRGRTPMKASDPPPASLREALRAGVLGFDPIERSLVRELIYFPDLVEDIAQTYKVHELTGYALRLADRFHKFYETCTILGSPQEEQRLEIVKASRQVLKNTLDLLGITAPEKM
ncbi:arginine--tRNA ligase [Candidatus Parcubacteria bacterium]|nr:arginine--tRNA ligase [Patescibacteria group bacterium]MBU4380987.1 arginine--tRNA ligase [Patescibacteria group bacterium]MCG2689299.1 arginine--tRNA ligase [Candidatus Parcubacteria bacterium]